MKCEVSSVGGEFEARLSMALYSSLVWGPAKAKCCLLSSTLSFVSLQILFAGKAWFHWSWCSRRLKLWDLLACCSCLDLFFLNAILWQTGMIGLSLIVSNQLKLHMASLTGRVKKFPRCYFWPGGLWGADIVISLKGITCCLAFWGKKRAFVRPFIGFWAPVRERRVYSPDRRAECGPALLLLTGPGQDESTTGYVGQS